MRSEAMDRAKYLLRFDDICPTMRWDVWEPAEAAMIRLGLRPIVAVVPDNQDPKLVFDPPRPDFWERVRHWQSLGWTIALHGFQHRYVNKNPGLMGLTHQSEFAGLPRDEQATKLREGIAILASHGVKADAWVAPSHSFDQTTVELLAELGVSVLSDGMHTWPFRDSHGMTWIPQQLWRFKHRRNGVWTICYHHNEWSRADLDRFLAILAAHRESFTDAAAVAQRFADRHQGMADRLASGWRMVWHVRLRSLAVRLRRRLRALLGLS